MVFSMMTNARPAARGFSLIELVVASAITAVLIGTIGSVIIVASRAIPEERSSLSTATEGSAALRVIADDLRQAVSVSAVTPSSITVVVADRDQDGIDESIEYAWSGTAGAPLTRRLNTETPEAVLGSAADFAVSAEVATSSVISEGPAAEGAERLLFSQDHTTGTTATVRLTTPVAMYILPELPANATGWRLTRIRLRASGEIAGRSTALTAHRADANRRPMLAVLWTQDITSTGGSASAWRSVTYTSMPVLGRTDGVVLALRTASSSGSTDVMLSDVVLSAHCGLLRSSNSGLSWNFHKLSSFPIEVYGRVTAPTALTEPLTRCEAVVLRVTPSAPGARAVELTVALPATPVVQ